jgi:hypothetical protein
MKRKGAKMAKQQPELGDEVRVVAPGTPDDGREGLVFAVEGTAVHVIFNDEGTNIFSASELDILKKFPVTL